MNVEQLKEALENSQKAYKSQMETTNIYRERMDVALASEAKALADRDTAVKLVNSTSENVTTLINILERSI